jgi:hypothetical protein
MLKAYYYLLKDTYFHIYPGPNKIKIYISGIIKPFVNFS